MSDELQENKKIGLALVIAQGKSVTVWARQNEVPKSTAYYWAKQPEVRRVVESARRQMLDRALGRMARRATAAADGISNLAETARSESVQLRAWRALLSDQIAVSKFAGWESRLAVLEEKASAQSQGLSSERGPQAAEISTPRPQVPE
jgi:hypothetical protein